MGAASLLAMPGPSAQEIVLEEAERKELVHCAASYTRPYREVLRANLCCWPQRVIATRRSVGGWG